MKRDYTRREFLRTGGAAIAGMALVPNMALSEESGSMKSANKVRIGVVGGGFGCAFQWHLDPNCVVQAVSDLREDRRANLRNTYKCDNVYNSLEELIEDKDVDAVAVFTGAPDHVRHTIACLQAGKHVISAVPAATNMEDAEWLLETVKKTGLSYMMAETSYYSQSCISARNFFKQGKFGSIFYTESEYHHAGLEGLFMDYFADPDGSKTWR